ncbi:DNA topoisomerase VI subunit B [Candidatus Woesearchaeota archaeon]|nr:MAG: DNA topoisomerase VI subunit B [Candidatus Woesearchaeota archaeon]
MVEKKITKESGQTKAHELAKKQREIGVAEFFAKNRHLLGFDNKRKALMTTIKEAVDNSLDACEDAKVLPEISVEVIDMGNDRFRIIVEDNGPGILKNQIPKIFAKLLYGSKFHSLKQNRGQQGIGISASVMYAQLTTGRPAKITSKIGKNKPANYYELHIDTQKNAPEIVKEETIEWAKDHGTKIELDIEATYQKGSQSIDEYLKQTAIVNPHATIIYTNPRAEQIIFPRATNKHPIESKEIKPHPYGVELGILIKMLQWSESRTLQSFLSNEFSRVSPATAKQICENAVLPTNLKPQQLSRQQAEQLIEGIKKTKIMAPPTDCISPIGAQQLEKGLKKEINAEFFVSTTRPPSVYRGNPFVIECGIAYGGELPKENQVKVMRFANKVPLLFQQGACAITKSVSTTNWRSYGLSQSQGNLPIGPVVILIHMASVWVPFTSEAKEAIAHYPEIIKEIRLAIQECGRKLASYISKKRRVGEELKKRSYIEKYIPHVAEALTELLELKKTDELNIENSLKKLLEKKRGKLEKVEMENIEYDEEFAKIGREKEAELNE